MATSAERRAQAVGETGVDLVIAIREAQGADAREDTAVARARAHARATLECLRAARDADAEHDRQLAQAEELALRLNGLVHGIEQGVLFPVVALSAKPSSSGSENGFAVRAGATSDEALRKSAPPQGRPATRDRHEARFPARTTARTA